MKDKAFPTPRSWARYCSPIIKDTTENRELLTLISAAVGEGVAQECVAYLKLTKTIDLKDMIAHPEKIKELKAVDIKFSLVSALSEYMKKDTKTTLPQVCKCVEYMEAEFSILLLRFVKQSLGVEKLLSFMQKDKDVADTCRKYSKYLTD